MMRLRDVARDLGVSYETARQLLAGSSGEPIPHFRTSIRGRILIPPDAYGAWKARQAESRVQKLRPTGPDLAAIQRREGTRTRRG
jgi:hypothetical protein